MIHVCFVVLENPKKMKLACLLLIKIGKAGFTGMRVYYKAIKAYDKLLELYPDAHTGSNNSALVYSNIEDLDIAIEMYKAAIGNRDPSVQSHIGLAGLKGI